MEEAKSLININDGNEVILKKYPKEEILKCGLLSLKPKLFVCNVDENSVLSGNNYTKNFIEKFGKQSTIIISAEVENQINQLDEEDKRNYMGLLKIKDTGLNNLVKKGYNLLNLETFFTSGLKESRAWTIQKNCYAPKAAARIHTDFEKGFIRAETVSYDDFVSCNGWAEAKTMGKMRLEGKDYIVKDGDVLNFRFNT